MVFLFLSLSVTTMAEIVYSPDMLSSIIEDIYEELLEEGHEVDFEQMSEDLQALSCNPINLNNTSEEELSRLVFLNDKQIENILISAYRKPLISIYELRLIEGLNDYEIRNMLPFVYVGEKEEEKELSAKEFFSRAKHELAIRFDARNIENNGTDPFYTAIKYRLNCRNKLQVGLTAERDAQEPSYREGKIYGADFWGGYAEIRDIWKFKKIVAGDYRVSFGEGLVINTNNTFYSKRNIVEQRKFKKEGINKKSSASEYGYLRGIGTTIDLGLADLTVLYSARKIDGKSEGGSFPTIIKTGYHRTNNEIETKRQIWQHVAGANATFKLKKAKIGITATEHILSDTLSPKQAYYNANYFRGNKQFSAGLNYRWIEKKFTLFGEVATTQNTTWGVANITGIVIQPIADVSISAVYRYYSKHFDNLLANAISSTSRINDENAITIGTDISLVRGWKFLIYADLFRFSGPKYGIAHSSYGFDLLYEMRYMIEDKTSMRLKIQAKEKDKKDKISGRYDIELNFGNWSVKALLNGNIYYYRGATDKPTLGGMAAVQAEYLSSKVPLRLQLRLSAFSAKNYNNRLYVYENDVLYAYNIPSFYGEGGRIYFNASYRITQHFQVYLKVSNTLYSKTWSEKQSLAKRTSTEVHTFFRFNF
ncbi:MAG: helix-hairpin-helix domain-containing protein [Paludibacteraceae bacterium]|nr:helix-hairpin-helix domain-containing protein [Paludibacteraceae bacterium]